MVSLLAVITIKVNCFHAFISVGERVAGRLQPPSVGQNEFHSGNFSERTIGNYGHFSHSSPDLMNLLAEGLQSPKFEVLLRLCRPSLRVSS